MDRIKFEETAKPGDLVFIVAGTETKDVFNARQIRCGIYERHDNADYAWLRDLGSHITLTARDTRHGFDFNSHLSNVSYELVASVSVGLDREKIAKQIGGYLGSVAEQDFRERWGRSFK